MEDAFDIELLAAAQGGDTASFAVLYQRHARAVLRYAFSFTRDDFAAEEVLQETFLTAWAKRRQARILDESLLPWLLAVARNHSRNEKRRARKRAERTTSLSDVDHQLLPDEYIGLDKELARLTPEDQRLCRLCLVEGLSYKEAAKLLEMTETAVGKRLQRARGRLRAALGENE